MRPYTSIVAYGLPGALAATPGFAQNAASGGPQDRVAQTAPSGLPMTLLDPAGPVSGAIGHLLWGLIALSITVVVVTGAFIIIGILIKPRADGLPPVGRTSNGVAWIYWGTGLSTVALIGFTGWTVVTMAAIDTPVAPPPFTVEVAAQQWWWELRYTKPDDVSSSFVTANEIHIPVGVPVRFRITSRDVIHSFWVPALAGKTDAIPGRTTELWLQADKPGVYRGQCAEYCGLEHALMALEVIAEPPARFQTWWRQQLEPAEAPSTTAAEEGRQQFLLRCGACHSVRGTAAGGVVGPDLTHLMGRRTIAAGVLANTVANLSGWIADPQGIKPGSHMPNVEMSGPELQSIRTYLLTLK